MRYVTKPKNSCPSWLLPATVRAEVENIARKHDVDLVKRAVYAKPYTAANGRPESETRDALNAFYFGKCAYCEKFCQADVEHYRPKGKAAGIDAHGGYPWLGYEWSNLIPACTQCNERSKLSKFPVSGPRVTLPHPGWLPNRKISVKYHKADGYYLLSEAALVLHPELDDPVSFFAFRPEAQRRGFEIYGVDTDGRGDKTADVCHLNRQDLLSDRLDVLRTMKQAVKKAFQDNDLGNIPDDKFPGALKLLFQQWDAESNNPKLTHTLLRKFVVAEAMNFDLLVLPLLNPTIRPVISGYYQAYRNGQL